jgi:hypothetical protein
VHFYSQNQLFQDPIPVKIRIEKINPYSILYEGTKYLTVEGQTVNYVYFAVDDRGEVLSIENSNQSAVGIINKNPMYESAPNPRNPG